MKRFFLLSVTAALLAGALPARAQTGPLTLDETLRLARERSLAPRASEQRVASAEALEGAAQAPLLPSIGLQVAPGFSTGRTTGTTTSAPGVALDTTVSGNQLLFDWGAAQGNADIARHQTAIARLNLEQAQQDAMASAAVGYFQVLRAEALAKLQGMAVQQAENHLRLGELRLRAGTGTRSETLQLQAQLANAQTALSQARNAVVIARLGLSNTLNTAVGGRALEASVSVPTRRVADAEVAHRLAERPEVKAQALRVETDARRASVERTAVLPGVSAVARYNQRNLDRGELFGGLGLSWSLFEGSRASNRAKAAEADMEADRLLLEQAKLTAELDIRQQAQTRDEARSRLASAQAGQTAAEEAYRIAVRRYELGLATQYELTDVQNTRLQAQTNAIQANYDLAIAEIRLTRALHHDLASSL